MVSLDQRLERTLYQASPHKASVAADTVARLKALPPHSLDLEDVKLLIGLDRLHRDNKSVHGDILDLLGRLIRFGNKPEIAAPGVPIVFTAAMSDPPDNLEPAHSLAFIPRGDASAGSRHSPHSERVSELVIECLRDSANLSALAHFLNVSAALEYLNQEARSEVGRAILRDQNGEAQAQLLRAVGALPFTGATLIQISAGDTPVVRPRTDLHLDSLTAYRAEVILSALAHTSGPLVISEAARLVVRIPGPEREVAGSVLGRVIEQIGQGQIPLRGELERVLEALPPCQPRTQPASGAA